MKYASCFDKLGNTRIKDMNFFHTINWINNLDEWIVDRNNNLDSPLFGFRIGSLLKRCEEQLNRLEWKKYYKTINKKCYYRHVYEFGDKNYNSVSILFEDRVAQRIGKEKFKYMRFRKPSKKRTVVYHYKYGSLNF